MRRNRGGREDIVGEQRLILSEANNHHNVRVCTVAKSPRSRKIKSRMCQMPMQMARHQYIPARLGCAACGSAYKVRTKSGTPRLGIAPDLSQKRVRAATSACSGLWTPTSISIPTSKIWQSQVCTQTRRGVLMSNRNWLVLVDFHKSVDLRNSNSLYVNDFCYFSYE